MLQEFEFFACLSLTLFNTTILQVIFENDIALKYKTNKVPKFPLLCRDITSL